MSAEANRWQRLRSAFRQVTALPDEDERKALLALLGERDRELTADVEALLERADDRIGEIVAASALDFAAHAGHDDADARRLVRIVQALGAVRRARARTDSTEPEAGPQTRLAR